ncbi:acyl-CoA synthetase [Azospirillum sp. Sh1]|uniref:acyl-CoA synthetase n=1 Tax=Azospirillum sp. Sh1 TaxID=2607285 RepID=UPI001B3BC345|nr:acyl-CoA synthetase [Azospirillum sp. Sh1]
MPVATQDDILRIEAEGWPDDLPESTYDLIRQGAAIDPDAPALTFFLRADALQEAEVLSHRDLLRRITQTANAFHTLGVGKDDVVSYILPNLPETHFTLWGAQAAGIAAAFNPLLEPSALAALLVAVRTKVLVTLAPFPGTDLWSRLHPVLDGVESLEHVVLVDLADHLPGTAGRRPKASAVEAQEGSDGLHGKLPPRIAIHDFRELVDRQRDDVLVNGRVIGRNDCSSFFCTGGTTGLPKIAMRRHGNEVANAYAVGRFLGDAVGPGKTLFCGLPLFHVNGVFVTGLLTFGRGAHVVLGTPQGYRGDGVVARFWEIVEHFRINLFSAVPTLYAALMRVPVEGRDIGSLEYGICGAAPMPVDLFRTFQDRTGLKILEGYGLTEAVCVSTLNPIGGDSRIGSIGLRLPGQLMKAAVLDDNGVYQRDCLDDEVGALLLCGPNVFAGYRHMVHNEGLWVDCGDGRRWMNTGDLGRRDPEGYFWLVGRKKELIIRGGHNLDPATIEEVLYRHPDVQLAAAVGRPDAYAGELPVAYVQLKPGGNTTADELMAFAKERIGERAAIPKLIRIIDEIPVTSVGKIFKVPLKRLETESAIADALLEAGIPNAEVRVTETAERGQSILVGLADMAQEERAKAVMGRFPFPYRLQPSA